MIAVIFEFTAVPQRRQEYLDIAAALGAQVQGFDGFISIADAPADSRKVHG